MAPPRDPPIRRRGLPNDVAQARASDVDALRRNAEVVGPAIDAHLAAYDAALTELADAHAFVADETDLDLAGNSRPAALWAVCGRGISLGRATVALLHDGFALDVIPTVRSLHEACRLLDALGSPGSDQLVDDWLADKSWVGHKRVLAARDVAEQKMRVEMIKAGVVPASATQRHMKALYATLSEVSHNRRRHIIDAIALKSRQMPIGPHPDYRVRGALVSHSGHFIAGLVTSGGFALALILGREWFVERFNPTFQALLELQARIPLDAKTLSGGVPGGSSPQT